MFHLFSVRSVFVIASVFPFLSVLACWACYYGLKHNKGPRIRTISETVIPFPENRIFPVTMNMECIFLLVAIAIREGVIRENTKVGVVYRAGVMVLVPSIVLGLSLLADLTLVDERITHLMAASVFFFGILIYYMVSDVKMKRTKVKVGWFSLVLPYISLLLLLGYMMLFSLYRQNVFIYSIGSICQYVMAFMIFLKIFIMSFEIPNAQATIDVHFDDESKKKK